LGGSSQNDDCVIRFLVSGGLRNTGCEWMFTPGVRRTKISEKSQAIAGKEWLELPGMSQCKE
jgi:hypothetical protein